MAGPGKTPDHETESEPDTDQGADVALDEDARIAEPPKYAVVLHNDDYTTMEFVIDVLSRFFRKTTEESLIVMMKVHNEGKGIAGIYSYEIAETKVAQVTRYARAHGFPLLCTAEPV